MIKIINFMRLQIRNFICAVKNAWYIFILLKIGRGSSCRCCYVREEQQQTVQPQKEEKGVKRKATAVAL